MFKVAIFAAVLTFAAGQQVIQQYIQNPYLNVPGNLVFPQGKQYFNYYNGQYQEPFPHNPSNIYKQYPFIALVNNQNQPIGYIYWINSDAVLQQKQQKFLPVRDYYGNLLGYYAVNQYKPGQQFQSQILNENLISQLRQFGFIYNPPNQDEFGFLVVKNPYVFYYNENGIIRSDVIQSSRFEFQFPYNFFSSNNNGQYQYPSQYYYGQKYQGQYVPRFQRP